MLGYVQLTYYQFGNEVDAREDFDNRLASFIEANPDDDVKELDSHLSWGDGSLMIMTTQETEGGATRDVYLGYVRVGTDMAFIRIIPEAETVHPEALETTMEFQETCMASGAGCKGLMPIAELFG